MRTLWILIISLALGFAPALSQQMYKLPDLGKLKHITTRDSEHASDIPGKETTMDFYAGKDGQVYTVYTFRGKTVAFSTHSNNDPKNTYRVFMDTVGNGLFQQINSGPWQIPAWARM